MRASCGAVYCVIGTVCGCVCVGGSVTTVPRNCVHRSSLNCVCIGEGSDHLQLIKFWPSRAPGKGVCGGANFFFGSALLQPARSVCVFALSPKISDYFLSRVKVHHTPRTGPGDPKLLVLFDLKCSDPSTSEACFCICVYVEAMLTLDDFSVLFPSGSYI